MIAVMIAAAMCVVPLFVIEDSDAYSVTTGETGVSAKASSMEPADFTKLMPSDYQKMVVAMGTLGAMGLDGAYYSPDSFELKSVSDLKMARGTEVTADTITEINGSSMTLEVDMTVKRTGPSTAIEFPYDGFQDLYRAFYDMPLGHTLTFKGLTITMEEYEKEITTFAANSDKNFVITEFERVSSSYMKISCSDIEYKNADQVKKLEFTAVRSSDYDVLSKNSFYSADFKDEVKTENVVGTTKTIALNDYRDCAEELSIKFVYDGKTYNHSETNEHYYNGMYYPDAIYESTTAGMAGAIMDYNISAPVYSFCGTGSYCLFDSSVVDASVDTNEKMKNFLNEKGTIGESYSDAKSVANSTSTSISVGGGSNNIIFYVIIGVLAVAVVALAVLMIKKK